MSLHDALRMNYGTQGPTYARKARGMRVRDAEGPVPELAFGLLSYLVTILTIFYWAD